MADISGISSDQIGMQNVSQFFHKSVLEEMFYCKEKAVILQSFKVDFKTAVKIIRSLRRRPSR